MSCSQLDGVLYVPIRVARAGGVQVELRRLDDGRIALPAYTSPAELVRGCGPAQRWAALDGIGMRALRSSCDVVLVDVQLPIVRHLRESVVDDGPAVRGVLEPVNGRRR